MISPLNFFLDNAQMSWRQFWGNGQTHSFANAEGYRDTQDDAINELNGVKAESTVGGSDNSVSQSSGLSAGMVLSGLAQGIQSASATAAQRRQLENQASMYDYQAKSASMNASIARQNMYNAYQVGAYRAMQQGMQDAQNIANVRSANASSGVRMNSGSKADVEKSARLIKEQNRIINQQNTTSSAMREYVNSANYKAQQIIAEGNAQAARTMQHGYSPLLSGLTTMSSAMTMSLLATNGSSWFGGK